MGGRKLNISLFYYILFITFFYLFFSFCNLISLCQKNIELNSTQFFIMKISNKQEFQQTHLIIHQILTLKTL